MARAVTLGAHARRLALPLALALLAPGARASAADGPPPPQPQSAGMLWRALGFLPSRALDLLDPVRARVRLGPGTALALRASESADLFLGSYTTVFAGLPGPRGSVPLRLPAGLESRRGAEVAVADLSTGVGFAPSYSATEFGAGFQFFLFGVDVGVDPFELVDLLAGFAGLDPRGDDLGR